jgi:hypothetical protein
MFVSVKTRSGMRSLELEQEARTELVRLFQSGGIPSHVPNYTLASGSDRTLRAIAWIMTSEADAVVVETAMQHHSVGRWVHFAVRGIALCMLADRVRAVLSGRTAVLSVEELKTRVGDFEQQFTTIMTLRSGSAA